MKQAMRPYVIRQGDHLTKLAAAMGFAAEEVWTDPANEGLRASRADSNMLAPGDVLWVPVTPKEGLPISPGGIRKFVATIPKVRVDVLLRDGVKVLGNEPYVLEGLSQPVMGTSDREGKLTILAPAHTREVSLRLPERGMVLPVRIGDLDPPEERSGVRQRLAHLGYHGLEPWTRSEGRREAADEEERLRRAIRRFQEDRGLNVTGDADEATRTALIAVHGS